MFNFLNMCNIVTITFQCFRLLILTSVSVLIYLFLSSWDFIFLSFCVPGNFLLDAGHYQFYLVRCWILYSCKYFCIPIHILELFSGILLNYLEKVWSFWAWQNHAQSKAATEARPFYVLCPVFHEPWSFPIWLERAGVIPIRKWALDTLPPFYWCNSFLLWVIFSHVWIAQNSGGYLKSTVHRSLAFFCSVALFSLDQVDLICLSCQLEQTLVSPTGANWSKPWFPQTLYCHLLNADSSGLSWSTTMQTGNSVKVIILWGNCTATSFVSSQGLLSIVWCSVSWKWLFYIFCTFLVILDGSF